MILGFLDPYKFVALQQTGDKCGKKAQMLIVVPSHLNF